MHPVRNHPMPSVIEQARHLPMEVFETGAILLKEGESARVLYILAEGSVEILKGDAFA